MKRLFFLPLILSFFMALPAIADDIKGRIIDAETNEPLPDAKITFSAKLNNGIEMSSEISSDSLGCFFIKMQFSFSAFSDRISIQDATSAFVSLTCNFFGYNQVIKSTTLFEGKDTVNIGDIKLKPSDVLLKEVTVKGHLRRFTMKGDTVIFNPEAFNLQEGARLKELIEKIPGVSFTNGQILWNGKPIQLRMNGNSIFGDGASLSELPVEAVQNIKQYEKKTELAERTGNDDSEGEQVLDINIKPGFMDKFYGDLKLSKATDDKYETNLSLDKLSDNDPIMLHLSANRNNWIISDSYYSSWQDQDARQQAGMINYQHGWNSKYKDAKERNKYSFRTFLNHYDSMPEDWKLTEMTSSTKTLYSYDKNSSYLHHIGLPLFTDYFMNIGNKTTLNGNIEIIYNKEQKTSNNESYNYSNNPKTDDTDPVITDINNGFSDEKSLKIYSKHNLIHYIDKGSINESVNLYYINTDNWIDNRHNITHRDTNIGDEYDVQQGYNKNKKLIVSFNSSYNQWINSNILLEGSYETQYNNIAIDNDMMRGDGTNMQKDLTNNYSHREKIWRNIFSLKFTQNIGRIFFTEKASLNNNNHWLDYRRGEKVDTSVTRANYEPNANIQMKWKMDKRSMLHISSEWSRNTPDIISTLRYTDNSNLLHVYEGNPDLKSWSKLNGKIIYSTAIPHGEQNINVELDVEKYYNPIMNLNSYNSKSGAYHTISVNGKGGHSESATIQYNSHLGGSFYFDTRCIFSNSNNYSHSLQVDGNTSKGDLCQHYFVMRLFPAITYNDGKIKCAFTPSLKYRSNEYNYDEYTSSHIMNYNLKMHCAYETKHWKFSFDPALEGGRGYISNELNKARMLIDGYVMWKFNKNKCSLSLDFNDILNKDNSISSFITAESYSESGCKYYHHYAGLTFKYKIEPSKKK